ncbi:MAG: ABC transporter substrate-binding protein [Candidatus Rokubacteria bacterium]|nr:ABC transporter substrate-binding protein [Candidatus Rokubacteria bacterium]
MRQITIGVAFHSPFYSPLFVAGRLGAFRDEGLDATIVVPPPGGTIDMLEKGQAPLVLSGVMRSFVLADRGGQNLVAIAEVNSRDGFFVVSRTPVANFTWRDLEGKTLALFGLAPTPWMCLQTALREQGADPTKVRALPGLDPAQGIEALKSGRADFLQTGQPTAEELVRDRVAHLAGPQAPIVGHVPYSSFVVTDATRKRDPEMCAAAVRALTRALRWMAARDGAAIAALIAPEFPETRPDTLAAAVTALQNVGIWSDGPRQDREAFDRLGRMLVAGGLIRTAGKYDVLVDDSFAEAAVNAVRA